ncbi:MAG: DUF6029 family protein [Bacteroidales bacterium]
MKAIVRKSIGVLTAVLCITQYGHTQDLLPGLRVWGNFQVDAQYYMSDTLIDAPDVPEKIGMNAFANLNLAYENLTIGFRYESYQLPLQGFDSRFRGSGIPYRFASWTQDNLEITVGNFYDQYGNGLVLRSYVEPNLGLDNSLDGLRMLYRPVEGLTLRTLIGDQRLYFDKGPGIVRGADAEANLNQLLPALAESPNQLTLGLSGVSKFQRDQDPLFNLPENVAAFAGRLNYSRGAFNINTEYAWKSQDPSAENRMIYKYGEALVMSASYSVSGFGLLLSGKRIDNMGFRSNRNAVANDLHINYLPAMTRQHVYSLTGMYPYATQPNGEMGALAELTFRLPRQSLLGGPYGTTIVVNTSVANSILREALNDTLPVGQPGTDGYTSAFFALGDEKYFQDFNVEINRRFTRNLRGSFTYMNLYYNQNVIEGKQLPDEDKIVKAHIFVADMTLRLPNRQSLRWELQHLATQQDKGSWAMALLEYNRAPHWFFALSNQYNYGNDDSDKRIHYFMVNAGYSQNANRFSLGWGRQRAGIVCIGGVCRVVPASYGFTLSVTSSF